MDGLLGGVEARPPVVAQSLAHKVSRSGVRFVFFDMNGVLVRAAVSRACMKLAQESGVTPDVIETIFWQYNSDVCRGSMSLDEFNTVLAERLEMLVDWNRYYLMAVEPTPGISELVTWVAENYKIGMVTNTFPALIRPMFDHGILPRSNLMSSLTHLKYMRSNQRLGCLKLLSIERDPIHLSCYLSMMID